MRCLAIIATFAVLVGCPGDLENPERFPEEPRSLCELSDFDVPALFQSRCGSSACHEGDEPAAGLDLVTSDPFSQLANVPSTQCEGRVRVVPNAPEESFLIEKLRGTQPAGCGQRMPFVSYLSGTEIGCIEAWIYAESGGEGPVDAGPEDDAGPEADGGTDVDGGTEVDGGPEPDLGTEPDLGSGGVDCSVFATVASAELCAETADGCDVLSRMMTSCDDTCALAGLVCTSAVDNQPGMCAPNAAAPLTCDDATRADLYCVCEPS